MIEAVKTTTPCNEEGLDKIRWGPMHEHVIPNHENYESEGSIWWVGTKSREIWQLRYIYMSAQYVAQMPSAEFPLFLERWSPKDRDGTTTVVWGIDIGLGGEDAEWAYSSRPVTYTTASTTQVPPYIQDAYVKYGRECSDAWDVLDGKTLHYAKRFMKHPYALLAEIALS